MKKEDKSKQGKKNRQAGARFELKVRKDLEDKKWIVDKWGNNVEFHNDFDVNEFPFTTGKIVAAKHKFRGVGIPMAIGTGFPDFICFPVIWEGRDLYLGNIMIHCGSQVHQTIIGVEVKSNGFLTKEEKEKCKWYLDNNVFSKILVAMKDKNKKGKILYKEIKK